MQIIRSSLSFVRDIYDLSWSVPDPGDQRDKREQLTYKLDNNTLKYYHFYMLKS